jgi:uncharacterized protein YndB with AHSA1/START domain
VKRVLIALGVVVALIAALLAALLPVPVTHSAERTRRIAAPPAAVYAQLNDLHLFEHWTPHHYRVEGTSTFEGPATGPGAVWKWQMKDGASRAMRIRESSPQRLVFDFIEGKPATNIVSLVPDGAGTRVTWSHEVTLVGWPKLMPLVYSVDRAIGPVLEENLQALATAVEPARP